MPSKVIWWLQRIVLWLFPVVSFYGYNYVGLNPSTMKMLYFISVPVMLLYVWNEIFDEYGSFICRGMKYLTLLLLISIISAYIFWGQDIVYGYRVTSPFLTILFFFYLKKCNFTTNEVERYIKLNAIIWFCLWTYAQMKAPEIIFGIDSDGEYDMRGIYRIHVRGADAVAVCYFIYLNKFTNCRKWYYLTFAILCFIGIFVQLSRQLIAISLVIGVVFLLRKYKFSFLLGFFLLVIVNFIPIKIPENVILDSLVDLTERQYEDAKYGEGSGYIRVKTYNYLLTEYTKNPFAIIIGNGVPHADTEYGKYYIRQTEQNGYYYSDAGYAEIYIFIGVIGLIVVIWLFLKVVLTPIYNSDFYWLKLFVIYILLYNIASGAILSSFIYLSIVLYLYNQNVLNSSILVTRK